jgi:hypothetical protein
MPLSHYSTFSIFMLRICVFKFGVLKILFILSQHGTKANLNSNHVVLNTMPNVIAVVDLPTMTLLDLSPVDFRRFLTVLVVDSQCCLRTGLFANCIRLTKRCNALSSRSDVTNMEETLSFHKWYYWCLSSRLLVLSNICPSLYIYTKKKVKHPLIY